MLQDKDFSDLKPAIKSIFCMKDEKKGQGSPLPLTGIF
jgi:hypothetical protein